MAALLFCIGKRACYRTGRQSGRRASGCMHAHISEVGAKEWPKVLAEFVNVQLSGAIVVRLLRWQANPRPFPAGLHNERRSALEACMDKPWQLERSVAAQRVSLADWAIASPMPKAHTNLQRWYERAGMHQRCCTMRTARPACLERFLQELELLNVDVIIHLCGHPLWRPRNPGFFSR